MASSVFFKFKSQKEPSRVSFDGTGISVFELKKEIINKSRLGDGTDFELAIFNEDTGEGEFSPYIFAMRPLLTYQYRICGRHDHNPPIHFYRRS